jgi:hypothetical protein
VLGSASARGLACACRALSNVADEGLLTDGFFWIPSLAGPTTVNVRPPPPPPGLSLSCISQRAPPALPFTKSLLTCAPSPAPAGRPGLAVQVGGRRADSGLGPDRRVPRAARAAGGVAGGRRTAQGADL